MYKMKRLVLLTIIALSSAFFVLCEKAEVHGETSSQAGYNADVNANSPASSSSSGKEDATCRTLGSYYDAKAEKCAKVSPSKNQEKNIGNIKKSFEAFAMTIVYLSTGLAGIMIILGGFQYTMSEGDSYKIEEAKLMLIRAGIGMLLAFASYNILQLVDSFSSL
ncbi:hypothetical protein CN918_27550 [Priestia megaterium]|nr:hypothetical protein CN918_27550 [Priestia megaterium]